MFTMSYTLSLILILVTARKAAMLGQDQSVANNLQKRERIYGTQPNVSYTKTDVSSIYIFAKSSLAALCRLQDILTGQLSPCTVSQHHTPTVSERF
jgi:hypothetical protein